MAVPVSERLSQQRGLGRADHFVGVKHGSSGSSDRRTFYSPPDRNNRIGIEAINPVRLLKPMVDDRRNPT
jgi:hypothetical protein